MATTKRLSNRIGEFGILAIDNGGEDRGVATIQRFEQKSQWTVGIPNGIKNKIVPTQW